MINKVILVGNLGQDPEMRFTPGGAGVCSFSLATNERWTSKEGKKEERTEWHRIVVWGKLAELCNQYLSKGRTAYIEGRIQYREWNDKEGHKRTTTEIVADNVKFLGGAGGASANDGGSSKASKSESGKFDVAPSSGAPSRDDEEDIPF